MKLMGRKTVKTGKVSAPMKATGKKTAGAGRHEPTHEEIAARAYELYLSRGSEEGHEEEDWLLAEAELRK
jgi:hypothetical protein